MQLCEFCTQNTTQPDGTICRLPKRENGILFAPCEYFERAEGISQDRYEQVKEVLLRMRGQAEAERRDDRPVYKIDIPMEFTEKHISGGVFNIPRDLHLDFLKVNFDDDKEGRTFLNRLEATPFYPDTLWDLKAVQSDLKGMVERWATSPTDFGAEQIPLNIEGRQDVVAEVYRKNISLLTWLIDDPHPRSCTDIHRLGAWFATLRFSIERSKTGIIKPRLSIREWPSILYFLFAQDVIENQEYKRCPRCHNPFKSEQRENARPTCSRACLEAIRRSPMKYGITLP
ncbi:MAG: hypothetical protein A3F84_08415 [Candidatus Handelsmanbacteria bacterium RIFCSPLOWO2_12_FULL_64_10]|uniref:Uncharacterized protein n=1 Tax=Handelsmanbacteria sp. (strain RIFCSPLOWO2_12_FULL_64_10) TaxID=1817868 RepID=A0A1F6D5L6_HANXR|nr:MAG: hypothetical protein A3F84_08415 [Candidatus Handelsmanbacteria bacterium RIFCSPLOWO2_12_FULL_64_10]